MKHFLLSILIFFSINYSKAQTIPPPPDYTNKLRIEAVRADESQNISTAESPDRYASCLSDTAT
jgi:hypothetical protein